MATTDLSRDTQLMVAPASLEDVDGMVDIHTQTNPGSYLTCLGKPVLTSMYKHFVRHSKGIALVARDISSQAIAGVAVGCEYPRRFYRGLALAVLPAYLHSRVVGLFRTSSLGVGATRRYQHQDHLFPRQDIVYFTQLNVSPAFQRRRVGSSLARALYDEAMRRGFSTVFVIANQDNASARALYEKTGCQLVQEFTTPSAVPRCLYQKDLKSSSNHIATN